MEAQLIDFIETYVEAVAEIERRAVPARGPGDTARVGTAEVEASLSALHANRELFSRIKTYDGAPGIRHPLLLRQARVLRLLFARGQGDPDHEAEVRRGEEALARLHRTFRVPRGDTGLSFAETIDAMASEASPLARRRLWEDAMALGSVVSGPLLDLVAVRNRLARDLGREDACDMELAFAETDEARIDALFADLEVRTREDFVRIRTRENAELRSRFGLDASSVMPWHRDHAFGEGARSDGDALLDEIAEGIDIPAFGAAVLEAADIGIRSLLERDNSWTGAGSPRERFRTDPRIRARCRPEAPDPGDPVEIWFTEAAHALHAAAIPEDIPFVLRQPSHAVIGDAAGLVLTRLALSPGALVALAGVTAEHASTFHRALALRRLFRVRWLLAVEGFERRLFRDPGRRLNPLWWRRIDALLGVPAPAGRDRPDWATCPDLALAPHRPRHRLLAELIAEQCLERLAEVAGPDGGRPSPAIGRWLRESLFSGGAVRNWFETVGHATGRPLEAAAFARSLAPAVAGDA